MFGILVFLMVAKWQDFYADRSAAWQWAAGYAAAATLLNGGGAVRMLVGFAVSGLYAWAYFALLRRFTDSLRVWIPLYLGGAVLPLLLSVLLTAKI
ncbi:hypothetical protein [Conchiformibius kuhniae]|uniref:Uncharacterized protein n=1 Tax=Conchiformibius kuhniae TaxID=211502 RepID=A0A8T9MS22_9NEIS|nr:hypothetical protein [Conchiformibius kuhniae]UOP04700.1 hypothetical protein LVJ77_11000 [Conchiformibius kuhniae]